jgi:small-conductance mechanosensitive channel
VVSAALLLLLCLTAVPKLKLALERFVLPQTSLDSGLRYTISTLAGYTFAALGIYVALLQVFDLGAMGYVFAALSVGIGFGLQEIVSNFVSGLILLFERPIKVGDLITVGATEGWVTKINIRATTIQTRDNISMLIPNKDFITQAVVNSVYGDPIIRLHVAVGVAYGSDTELVRKVLEDVGRAHPRTLASRPVEALFLGFGESSLDFEVRVWIPEASEHPRIASDLRFKIDQAFRENGVAIPFPQRDLHLRSVDEAAASRLFPRDGRN